MNREQAVTYLKFSGFSEEQIKAIEGAFTCDKCVYSTSECCQYDDITETIPPFEPCDKCVDWIPVSERLPKIADVYRVTRYFPNNVMNPQYMVDACFFDGSNTWYNDNRINHERAYADNVIAWQENPEPYKAESEE